MICLSAIEANKLTVKDKDGGTKLFMQFYTEALNYKFVAQYFRELYQYRLSDFFTKVSDIKQHDADRLFKFIGKLSTNIVPPPKMTLCPTQGCLVEKGVDSLTVMQNAFVYATANRADIWKVISTTKDVPMKHTLLKYLAAARELSNQFEYMQVTLEKLLGESNGLFIFNNQFVDNFTAEYSNTSSGH
ncbi:uncharacterized protein LOC115219476 [Argonauta hians]